MSILAAITPLKQTVGSSFSPLDLPNLKFWFDPSDASSITLSMGEVVGMTDKGPNSYDAAPGSGFSGPTIATAYANGKDALQMAYRTNLDFGGTTAMVINGTPFHLFFLMNSGDFSDSAFNRFFNLSQDGFTSNQGYHAFFSNSSGYEGLNIGVTGAFMGARGPNVPLGTNFILEVTWDGVSLVYNSGSLSFTYNATTVDTLNSNAGQVPQSLNNSFGTPDPENYGGINGIIGNVIMCGQILSSGDRIKTINYLKALWGL